MVEATNENAIQTQLETFENPLTVPSHKLDADQYSAEDLDGVTESLFGSGNIAYASLQASQTDAFLTTADPFASLGNANFDFIENSSGAARIVSESVSDASNATQAPHSISSNDDLITDTDRGIDAQDQFNIPNSNGGAGGNFTSATVGAVSASELSSNQGSFAPSGSGLSLQEGLNGADGQNGETPNIPEIQTPTDGIDGSDGTNGTGGDNTNIEVNLHKTARCKLLKRE